MRGYVYRFALIAAVLLTAIFLLSHCGTKKQPRIVLWAWERPEDFRFAKPDEISVAFLAQTIQLQGEAVIVKPRLQPMKFTPGTDITAVTRIEAAEPTLSRKQLELTVSEIAQLTQLANFKTFQIDFDAKESERSFYKDLLTELRKRLPEKTQISITALASWCIYDTWIKGLPIDEAIPMLFRMGVEHDEIVNYLNSGQPFRCDLCRSSLGISIDEPIPLKFKSDADRVYIFNPRPWTKDALEKVLKRL